MPPKKNKKDILFEIKDRAYGIIKERFKDFAIISEDYFYYVIAYKKPLEIVIKSNTLPFQPTERRENKEICINKLIAFMDVPISKEMKEWISLGCEHDYIDEDGKYIENIS